MSGLIPGTFFNVSILAAFTPCMPPEYFNNVCRRLAPTPFISSNNDCVRCFWRLLRCPAIAKRLIRRDMLN